MNDNGINIGQRFKIQCAAGRALVRYYFDQSYMLIADDPDIGQCINTERHLVELLTGIMSVWGIEPI